MLMRKIQMAVMMGALSLTLADGAAGQMPPPADLIGGGNFTNGNVGKELDYQIQVLKSLGANRCRVNLYPDAYLMNRNWDSVNPKPIDAVMLKLHAAGIRPMLLLEYYSQYQGEHGLGSLEQWKVIGKTLATRYRPGGEWAKENNITDGFGIDLYTAFNEPEPGDFRLGGSPGPKPFIDSIRGLAEGVHSVDPNLKVIAGGFMAANAWKDWTLRGLAPALAPLLNDGTLAGLDLHTYYDVQWAPMEGGYTSSAQHNFDMVKLVSGITRDIEFFSTEFNYKNRICTPEQAAAGMLTGIWDHLAVVGNDGRTLKTGLALPWNVFNEQKTDDQFGMVLTAEPYIPAPNGMVLRQVLELTKDMRIVAADPRGTGMIALIGGGRTMWVWQNRTGWTDQPGETVELCGIPAKATEVEVYGWEGLRKRVAVKDGGVVTIEGLGKEQTYMFMVRTEATGEPEALLPARAAKRIELKDLAAQIVEQDVPLPYAVLAQETFDREGDKLTDWGAEGDANDPTLAAKVVDATPQQGTCGQLAFTFNEQTGGSRSLGGGTWLKGAQPTGTGKVYLRFLLRGSKDGRPVRIRMSDRDNETIVTKTVSASPVWRRVYVRLDADWDQAWGEGSNNKLDWPLRGLAFEALSWGGGSPEGGEMIWVRDAQLVQTNPQGAE